MLATLATKLILNCISDDNECLIGSICGNGTCANINGGFECSCNDGYAPGVLQVRSYYYCYGVNYPIYDFFF